MKQIFSGMKYYDPTEVDLKFVSIEAEELKPYGFCADKKVTFEGSSIYFHFQGTSSFIPAFLKAIEDENKLWRLEISAPSHSEVAGYLNYFNGKYGHFKLYKGDIVSSIIPEVVFEMSLYR